MPTTKRRGRFVGCALESPWLGLSNAQRISVISYMVKILHQQISAQRISCVYPLESRLPSEISGTPATLAGEIFRTKMSTMLVRSALESPGLGLSNAQRIMVIYPTVKFSDSHLSDKRFWVISRNFPSARFHERRRNFSRVRNFEKFEIFKKIHLGKIYIMQA